MRIFLTGATGFIGSAVAKKLQAAGHSVLGLARSDEAEAKLHAQGITPLRGDLTDAASLRWGAQGADGVINTASIMSFGSERGEIERSAVEVMLEVLEGSNKPFLYTSDQLIYGPTGNTVADEDTPLNPLPFVTWRPSVEKLVLNAVSRGIRSLVIRPVAMYGHGRDHLMPMLIQMARKAGVAYYVGSGEARWSMVHVDDAAELYACILESAPAGTLLNASSEPAVSMKELAEVASQVAGLNGKTASLPLEKALEVMGPFASNFTFNLQVSAVKATRLLGWKPQAPSLFEEAERGVYRPLLEQEQ